MWGVEICKIYSKIMKKYHHCEYVIFSKINAIYLMKRKPLNPFLLRKRIRRNWRSKRFGLHNTSCCLTIRGSIKRGAVESNRMTKVGCSQILYSIKSLHNELGLMLWVLKVQGGKDNVITWALSQYKDRLSQVCDSHVKDHTVGETVLSSTWESLYW